MSFVSVTFLCFIVAYFAVAPLLRERRTLRLGFMTMMSLVFYGWADPWWILLLVLSGLIDFVAAIFMERFPRFKAVFLVGSLVGNLGILGLFKYSGFVAHSLSALCTWLGVPVREVLVLPTWSTILPAGISFYTFQSMSYTIDVYRGELKATRDPLHFFAYLAIFPQLVAGPIVRAGELLPQLLAPTRVDLRGRVDGLWLIVWGFAKKMLVADNLAPYVDAAFQAQHPPVGAIFWWWIMLLFALQIYGDFSGYTSIARGLGRWMGLSFPVNFRHPYLALGIRDFWTRWHISLSTWFRDYCYRPLGGGRVGHVRAHCNLWLTMLASGLWHGAAWTFLLWGAFHAALVSCERLTRWPDRLSRVPGGYAMVVLITFLLVLLTWVPFRAGSLEQAWTIMGKMCGANGLGVPWAHPAFGLVPALIVGAIFLREVLHACGRDHAIRMRILRAPLLEPIALVCVVLASVYFRGPGHQFIYFQF